MDIRDDNSEKFCEILRRHGKWFDRKKWWGEGKKENKNTQKVLLKKEKKNFFLITEKLSKYGSLIY